MGILNNMGDVSYEAYFVSKEIPKIEVLTYQKIYTIAKY